MIHIDADMLMDPMSLNGLLAAHDQELILTGQSKHQRNWLLLEHMRHMEMQTLVKFCEIVREFEEFYSSWFTVGNRYVNAACNRCHFIDYL